YDLCARTITPEQCAGLDLSSWTVACNGAEPVQVETLDRFTERFAAYGFRREAFLPCYGLAEATLAVTCGPRDVAPTVRSFVSSCQEVGDGTAQTFEASSEGQPLVSCGRPFADD